MRRIFNWRETWNSSPYNVKFYAMATTPKKKTKSGVPQRRTASRRERSQSPPAQFRVPDLRDPKVVAELRREAKLMAQHPENDAIDDWIEQVYDWESWK